jgi:hypothetical protein
LTIYDVPKIKMVIGHHSVIKKISTAEVPMIKEIKVKKTSIKKIFSHKVKIKEIKL